MSGFSYMLRRFFTLFVILATAIVLAAPASSYAGFLYVLNDDSAGSNIYGFQVNESSGALTALPGFPISPGLGGINSIVSERMIVDATNARLYVINDTSDTVSAYSINRSTGALTAMPFSPIALGTGNFNSIAVHPSGSPLIVANNGTLVLSYVITPTTATPAMGSPYSYTGTSGFSSEISTDGNFYYVGGNTGSNIAGFSIDASTGVLTALPGSPFPAGASNVLAYAVDNSGRLFSVDSVDAIRIFTSSSGALSPVTGNPFISGLTQRRFGIMHPNQNFYIVAGNTGNNVGVYQVSGSGAATTVAAVAGSPFATGGTTANCLAITGSGNFLYVGNRISRNVTTFSVNGSTGVLTSLGVQPSNTLGSVGAINGIGYMPDAVPADISGYVSNGTSGVPGVIVRLTSSDMSVDIATRTNQFGRFSFSGVLTGRTYTVTPIGKGYTFDPASRQIDLTGDVTDADFAVTVESFK